MVLMCVMFPIQKEAQVDFEPSLFVVHIILNIKSSFMASHLVLMTKTLHTAKQHLCHFHKKHIKNDTGVFQICLQILCNALQSSGYINTKFILLKVA